MTEQGDRPADRRFPRSVFGTGSEPDPRFTLANERTFLAWLRSGLALMAAGVALHAFELPMSSVPRSVAAILFVALGIGATVNAWVGWARVERAIRRQRPLPGMAVGLPLTLGVVAAGLMVLAGLLLE